LEKRLRERILGTRVKGREDGALLGDGALVEDEVLVEDRALVVIVTPAMCEQAPGGKYYRERGKYPVRTARWMETKETSLWLVKSN
jgi:hypothetical protein